MSIKRTPVKGSEIERRGSVIYKQLRKKLEREHWGEIVVIDIHSGDYEVAPDDLTATLRMFERRPHALTWGERIGGGGVYSFGFRLSLASQD